MSSCLRNEEKHKECAKAIEVWMSTIQVVDYAQLNCDQPPSLKQSWRLCRAGITQSRSGLKKGEMDCDYTVNRLTTKTDIGSHCAQITGHASANTAASEYVTHNEIVTTPQQKALVDGQIAALDKQRAGHIQGISSHHGGVGLAQCAAPGIHQ